MKHTRAISFLACVLATALCAACSDDHARRGDRDLAVETGGTSAAGASGDGAGFGAVGGYVGLEPEPDAAVEPSFEPFEIAIGQQVTVGAFRLDIEKAEVTPERHLYDERARVELAFSAENLSTELHAPLGAFWAADDALLLEIEGEYFYGEVQADEVPGLRNGAGKLTWIVPTANVTPEQIASATITIGDASQNAVVIPLADPSTTTTLNDIELDASFTVQGIRASTLEITSGRVQYGSRGRNEPYEAGRALLVLSGGLGGPPDVFDAWYSDELVLDRPDGISVASDFSALINKQPEDAVIGFPIVQPVSGTYVVTVYGEDGKFVTQSIVVP